MSEALREAFSRSADLAQVPEFDPEAVWREGRRSARLCQAAAVAAARSTRFAPSGSVQKPAATPRCRALGTPGHR